MGYKLTISYMIDAYCEYQFKYWKFFFLILLHCTELYNLIYDMYLAVFSLARRCHYIPILSPGRENEEQTIRGMGRDGSWWCGEVCWEKEKFDLFRWSRLVKPKSWPMKIITWPADTSAVGHISHVAEIEIVRKFAPNLYTVSLNCVLMKLLQM